MELLQEFLSEAVLLLNNNGEIVLSNARSQALLGYSEEELGGTNIDKILLADYPVGSINNRIEFITRLIGSNTIVLPKNGLSFEANTRLMSMEAPHGAYHILFLRSALKNDGVGVINGKSALYAEAISTQKSRLTVAENLPNDDLLETNEKILNRRLLLKIQNYKSNEQNFIRIQRLYDAIVHHFPEGVIGVLNENLDYVLLDGSELADIDLPSLGLVRQTAGLPIPFVRSEETLTRIKKAFEGTRVAFELATKDRIYHIHAVPLPDEQNKVWEILCVVKNITKIKELENKLVKAWEKEKDLGELKSRFVSMACHEFKTPLATILSSLFLLEQYSDKTNQSEKILHASRIRRSVNNLTQILNDFLDLEKLDKNKIAVSYSSICLPELVRDIIQEFDLSAARNISLEYLHHGFEDKVYLDAHLLASCIRNLLSNALKYSKNESTVFVRSEIIESQLIINFKDSGIGIPVEEQVHIFERFYRARNSINFEGTGLGLHIVAKNAALLNGTISFVSTPNVGTEFTLTLPVGSIHLVTPSLLIL